MNRITALSALLAVLAFTPPARAADESQPPKELWLYHATNLYVAENIDKLEALWKRAKAAGYTHVLLADSKFAKLGDMDERYFRNLNRTKEIGKTLGLTIVPALFNVGYSNNMLWHDPNLAEGLPVKGTLFVVGEGGVARPQADPPVALDPAEPGWKDESITLDAAGHAAKLGPAKGNSRLVYGLKLPPYRCYHVSVKVKTDDFSGTPEVKALAAATERSLQWQKLGVKRTQDWTEHHVVFNTLDTTDGVVNLYFGVWGHATGSLQWKDWKIEEVGLLNVLRRPGTPLTVVDEKSGKAYAEGQDFERVVDPLMGSKPWNGEYTAWHESPPIRTKGIPAGTRLRVSWYHPAIIYEGQVSACVSEPKTAELLADEAKRVKAAFGAPGYMMSHDEFRTFNWDHACEQRNLSPGRMLAENARECVKLLRPARAYVWNDMFDPHHNAVKGPYYLVRGDWTGSWEGLDKDVVIVNWNYDARDASLKFFADRGHPQLIAGYYDGDLANMRNWLASAAKVKGVVGYMYTTWAQNYDQLEAFAKLCRE